MGCQPMMIGRAPMMVPQYVQPPMQTHPARPQGGQSPAPQQWPPPRVQQPQQPQQPNQQPQQPYQQPQLAQQSVPPYTALGKLDMPTEQMIKPVAMAPLGLSSPESLALIPAKAAEMAPLALASPEDLGVAPT